MEFLEHTLANGLQIVAECSAQAWSVALGMFVRAGARDEPQEMAGVSHFLEHMAFKGSDTLTEDDIDRQFDELGAHYNARTSEEQTIYYAAVLPECQDQALRLLAELLRPALRPDDFALEKQVILEEIRMYEDQPPFGADDKCRAAYFGSHPLGHSVLGSAQTITDLSVEAMREYFRRRYSPDNVVLAAAGKVDFDALVASAQRYCGHWEAFATTRVFPPCVPQTGFHVLRKESATHQYVVQLAAAPGTRDPRRFAAELLAIVLGDDTGSRLFWELVDPGLAETASLTYVEYEDAGIFVTYLGCDPHLAADNLQRVHHLYQTFQQEGPTEEELSRAKNKLSSHLVLLGERPRSRLFSVGCQWLLRREYRSTQDDLQSVAAVRLDDLTAVLSKFPLTRNTTVAIGPLERLPAPC